MKSRYYSILFSLVAATLTFSIISLFVYIVVTEPNAQQIFVEKMTSAVANAIMILIESLVKNNDFLIF